MAHADQAAAPPVSSPPVGGRGALFGFACGAGAALIWGVQAVVSRQSAADGLGPVDVTILRFLTAALVLMPFALRRLKPFPVGRLGWRRSLALTLLGGAPFATVLVGGSTFAPALHTAVIGPGLIPVFTAILSYAWLKERTPPARILGLALIVGGIGLFSWRAVLEIGQGEAWRGDLLFVMAAAMWSVFAILAKRWGADAFDLTITLSILSLTLLPVLALLAPVRIAAVGLGPLALQALYQGLLVGVGSVFLYATANQVLGAARATLFLPIVPAITAIASALLIGEWPSLTEVLGMVVVMTGMTVAIRA